MKKLLIGLSCCLTILGLTTGCGSNKVNIDTNTSSGNSSNEISDNKGYQMKINDNVFYFPFELEKLLNIGFSITEENKQRVLSTTEDYIYIGLDYNNKWLGGTFGVYIKPNGDDIKNAIVLGVKTASEHDEDLICHIEGLEISYETTVEDVVNKLGKPEEPKSYNDDDYILAFIYRKDNRQLTFSFISGELNAIYVFPEQTKKEA